MPPADGDEGVDHLDAGLQRRGDRGALDDGGRRDFDRTVGVGEDRPGTIEGAAEGVHDSTQQHLADWHLEHPAGTLYLAAGSQALWQIEQDHAEPFRIEVGHQAQGTPLQTYQLFTAHAGKSHDPADLLADGGQGAHLLDREGGSVRGPGQLQPPDGTVDQGGRVEAHLATTSGSARSGSSCSATTFSSSFRYPSRCQASFLSWARSSNPPISSGSW